MRSNWNGSYPKQTQVYACKEWLNGAFKVDKHFKSIDCTLIYFFIFCCSFYMYDGANLLSVTTGKQTTRYTYHHNGDLTKVIYPTATSVEYSWNQFGLLSGIKGYNQQNKLIQGVYFSYDWNGKVTVSRIPQGDSAELVFNEEGRMMDVSGGDGFSDVRFESVKTDDQVVRIVKQGDQVR